MKRFAFISTTFGSHSRSPVHFLIALAAVAASMTLFSANTCAILQDDPNVPPSSLSAEIQPNKETLIETLKTVFSLLQEKEFQKVSTYFVLPPNFKPEMFEQLLKNRELSAEGIAVLESQGTFGPAADCVGAERAKSLSERAGQNLEECFGISLVQASITAEVLASWDGRNYKLFRINNVGKLGAVDEKMDQRSPAERLPELEAAVAAKPDDIGAIASYAQALFQVGNFPAAWQQLRHAFQLNSRHDGIHRGLQSVFTEFKLQGLFNVGVPSSSLRSVLGEPDKVVDLSNGFRWVFAFLAVDFRDDRIHEIIDLRGATEELFMPGEIIDVVMDGRGWQCGLREKSGGSARAHFFLPGQSISDWAETVEVERILNASKTGEMQVIVQAAVNQLGALVKNVQHKILEQDENTAIVAFMFSSPSDNSARHQLVRYFRGPVDVHRLAYTRKGLQPPDEKLQANWLAIMKAATLKSIQRTDSPSP